MLRFSLCGIVVLLTLEAAWPPVYRFPPSRPFAGELWYDPYEGFDGSVLRANFHAHTGAWGGLSSSSGTVAQVVEHYERQGYDVAGISNYMRIEPPAQRNSIYVPAYEHGFGLRKIHQTVVGARRVSWFDAPLIATRRHKQYLVDKLAETGPVVVLNHPSMRGAYSRADMELLTGYQGLEVASKYGRDTDFWDSALSAGRLVWGFASDDGHHVLERESHSGIGWLCVSAKTRTAEGVTAALRAGQFYSVFDRHKEGMPELRAQTLDPSGELCVELDGPVDEIRFIGQGGRVLASRAETDSAAYPLQPEDTYVRVEAALEGRVLFTNPVFRHAGAPFGGARAEVRPLATRVARAATIGVGLLALWILVPRGRRPKARARLT